MSQRPDGRREDQLRPVRVHPGYISSALGSCLIEMGRTRVICTATPEDGVPPFLAETGGGWISAEYGMLPGCSKPRIPREVSRGRPSGRTMEIQRLIGRSMRAVVDLQALGPRTVWIDCDVLEADGGTRTAAITGGFVALVLALRRLRDEGVIETVPVRERVAAVSVGRLGGRTLVDLCYAEDAAAEVDMNVVMTESGRFVEIQGTAETTPFDESHLHEMLAMAAKAIRQLTSVQDDVLG